MRLIRPTVAVARKVAKQANMEPIKAKVDGSGMVLLIWLNGKIPEAAVVKASSGPANNIFAVCDTSILAL